MEQNEKILIITYYWPPSGGAGVQRWLKFCKFLPENGYDPIVFTPENPSFDQLDESLLKDVSPKVDVLKFPIWEPYQIFKKLTGTKQLKQGQVLEEGKQGLLKRLSIWVRGNLFIPDPRVFWVKPSVEYLADIIKTNGIKKVITTGPPHSVHLIGLKLKMKQPSLTWIADFRDPWTEWDIMKKFKMLPFVWKRHRKLESNVLKVADAVLATGPSAALEFKNLGARKTHFITNGFDESDLPEVTETTDSNKFVIAHFGMVNDLRDPTVIFKALENVLSESVLNLQVELRFVGILNDAVKTKLHAFPKVMEVTTFQDSVSHEKVFEEYAKADVLVLMQSDSKESQSQLPGKLFEYMSLKKPVLGLGYVQSDVAKILNDTGVGQMFEYQDQSGVRHFIEKQINSVGKESLKINPEKVSQYSRKVLTKELATWLDSFSAE